MRLLSIDEWGVSLGSKFATSVLPAFAEDIIFVDKGSLILELLIDLVARS
jgi:hypothetical protein